MGKNVICLTGEEAARIFYDRDKFTRKGAMPVRIKETLFWQECNTDLGRR